MNPTKSSPSALPQPTRVRYGVLGFACALSMITYLDRVCIASAVKPMMAALGLQSAAELDWAFAAFAFAYAIFEIPSGWLGDVYGPRRTLIRIVLWWSLFTALTGMTGLFGGLMFLVIVRFLFGMGEAGAYPNITRALHNWFPFQERGLAQGAVWMAGRLMGGLTPLLWLVLVEGLYADQGGTEGGAPPSFLFAPVLHWRATFVIFGIIGLAWCLLFGRWFRNHPAEKPTVNEPELALIQEGRADLGSGHAHVPWLRLLGSRNLWALCLMYFCASYGWYFNITYLPHFLDQRGVDSHSALGAIYKGGPLWLGACACLLGGWLTDWFIRRTGSRKWGRRLFGVGGHGLCAVCCFLAFLYPADAFSVFLFISLAAFWNDLTMGAAWAGCQDIGKRYAAIVAGCMNFIGNLGGAAVGKATGFIIRQTLAAKAAGAGVTVEQLTSAQRSQTELLGYKINFFMFGVAYLLAVALWLCFDSTKPVVPENEKNAG
jgi:ACS family glucarate transporter-like MFS transporter